MSDKTTSKNPGRQTAHDGHRPGLLTEGHKPHLTPIPGKVQGGYQGPGGGKPATPTTGSGVAPAAPGGGDKK
jgi:hypothetical protein